MAFCTEACCNAEARARKQAAEKAEFERRQAEFEAFLRDKGIDPDPKPEPKAANLPDVPLADAQYGVLTLDELSALAAWADAHPVAG